MAHALLSFLSLFLLPTLISSISSCGEPCRNYDDCWGQLICISGKCNDDPTIGTHICPSNSPSAGGCKPSGIVSCQDQNFSTYACSPPITSSTHARLTNNDFSKGGNGGGPSECDGNYHANTEHIVALSTGWYAGGTRCEKLIYIIADNGRSTTAKVVDECDSRNACDAEHGYEGPCAFDVINASNAVWDSLGLSTDLGVVNVTWSMLGSEDLFYFSCL